MTKDFDCVLCGSCVADLLVRPVPLETPIGGGKLLHAEPIQVTTGGIVSNSGIAMARLGMKVAAFSYVGNDDWAGMIRRRLEGEGVDCTGLLTHPTAATSTTAVLIDPSGERSFAHCVGAPKLMDKRLFLDHLDLFARSRMMLVGYYSLMPNLEGDLPEFWPRFGKPAARRPSTRPATAARCSRWIASCRMSMFTCPATTRPRTKPGTRIRGRSSTPIARAARRACWA